MYREATLKGPINRTDAGERIASFIVSCPTARSASAYAEINAVKYSLSLVSNHSLDRGSN